MLLPILFPRIGLETTLNKNRTALLEILTAKLSKLVPRIDIDKRQAMIEGVALADIYSSLSTYLGGSYIGNFNRFGRLYQSYIQAAPDDRLNARSIDSYFVTNASGESVPISALVNVRDTVGVEYITQFNLYQSIFQQFPQHCLHGTL